MSRMTKMLCRETASVADVGCQNSLTQPVQSSNAIKEFAEHPPHPPGREDIYHRRN